MGLQIQNHFQSKMNSAPKIVCNQNKNKKFKEICFEINTNFKSSQVSTFKTMINAKFEELKQHILNGRDIIIPLLTATDIAQNGRNKQIIYHKIGMRKLSFSFLEYIQNKIDELAKYAFSVQIVEEYNCDNLNYKQQIIQTMDNRKKCDGKMRVFWQWKNGKNEWISYDYKSCQKIEALPIDGMYEYAINSFIAKISKKKGLHVNISNDTKRDIRRIKKYKNCKNDDVNVEIVASKRINHGNAIKAKKAVRNARFKTNKMNQSAQSEYIINWQWKNDQNRWIVFDQDVCEKLENLQNRESYQYTANGTMYKITKETRNFAVQINLETFRKRHVRQARKLKVNRMKELK